MAPDLANILFLDIETVAIVDTHSGLVKPNTLSAKRIKQTKTCLTHAQVSMQSLAKW
jgi:hypothetical protein